MNVSWRNKINGLGLNLISYWTSATGRCNYTGLEHMEAARAGGNPVLWAAWHGQSMSLIPFFHGKLRDHKVQIMMPDDWRGESLYYWTKRIGFYPLPMDLENKGMETARRFAELIKQVKSKEFDNYISPDGPGGPSHVVKPGIVFLAQKTGLPIVPIGAYTRQSYEVKRWDAYVIPLPFNRIEVVIGEPIPVPRQADREAIAVQLAHAIHHVTAEAKAIYYARYGHG